MLITVEPNDENPMKFVVMFLIIALALPVVASPIPSGIWVPINEFHLTLAMMVKSQATAEGVAEVIKSVVPLNE